MPKIAIVDTDFEDSDLECAMAHEAGVEVACFQGREPEQVIANATGADGVVTSYARFPRKVFEALPRLKVVSRTGVGFDTIDLDAATDHGVAVCTAPGYGTEVVSDHAITLALCVLRRVNEIDADMRSGIWNYKPHRPLGQVYGRTFGVVGMGEIGRAVARKAAGLGFRVICSSRSLVPGRRTPEGYDIYEIDDLLARADVVSFHCALTSDTYHLLDARRIELMKPDAVVINTSRGAVVDTDALAVALCEGHLWGAGLDVFEGEPVDFDSAICKAPRTVLTSHAAYWSEESGVELRTRAMQSAIDVVLGRRPADCLNPSVFDR
ncbi:MAG: C-terminal binding protein [Eggerthellaceae bacterium]|nr:C-terminal binding protein [Eggerthellaceae bacterium]